MESSFNSLIIKLKDNDKEAFAFVFRMYYRELYYLAFRMLQNTEDARDITQATFIKFWEHRRNLIEDKPVKPLLFVIQKNNCLDYLRQTRIKAGIIPDEQLPDKDWISVLDTMTASELEFKIVEAISELPPKCRQIFELSRFVGLKYQEIATQLNISLKTVENQMGIALDKLRINLADYLVVLIIFFFKIF